MITGADAPQSGSTIGTDRASVAAVQARATLAIPPPPMPTYARQPVFDALFAALPCASQAAVAWRHPRLGRGGRASPDAPQALLEIALQALAPDPGASHAEIALPTDAVRLERCEDGIDIALVMRAGEPADGRTAQAGTSEARAAEAGTADTSATDTRAHGDPPWMRIAPQLALAALRAADADVRIESLEKSRRLLQALYEISDLSGSRLEMHEMLARVHGIVGRLMSAENFYIVVYDSARGMLRYLYFADSRDAFNPDPDAEFAIDHGSHSLTAALLRDGRTFRGAPRALLLELGLPIADYAGGPISEDWLGVPLRRGDEVCGALVVQNYLKPECYDDQDRSLLEYVAQHILTALDRKTAQVELEQRVAERTRALQAANLELQNEVQERQRGEKLQRALYRIAELSVSGIGLDQFFADLHSIVGELLYARNFYVALLSDDGRKIHFPYFVDEKDSDDPRANRDRPRGKGMTEYVLDSGKPALASSDSIRALEAEGVVSSFGSLAHCWLGVPLTRDGVAEGVIGVQSYTPGIEFGPRDQELLTFVAHHVAAALARKRAQDTLLAAHAELETRVETRTRELAETNRELREQIGERLRAEQRLRHQARHDRLTGLPNRAHLQEKLDDALIRVQEDDSARFAVLFLDIDHFKLINDSVGHVAGDDMLVESSRRIAQATGRNDTVARLGGDEFALLAEGIDGAEDARRYAGDILHALGQPMWVEGREVYPSASIGIALWHPRYRKSEELLRDADAAMYRAKRLGRNRSEVFDEAMRADAMRLLDLEADLRRAIVHDAFLAHYQPIQRLSDGVQVGCEALVRWQHETRGMLTPADFIGVGEDGSLIEQVDWLMYRHVMSSMGEFPEHYVSINVSPRHFLSDNFADRILRMLDEARQDPSRLRIEITEVALIEDASRALTILRELRRQGICAFLDDFGTGFSALSYLHRFPIQGLKIDRSFVAGLDGEDGASTLPLVRAILAMALTLGIDTIAEGIETEAQRQILHAQGCQFGQGYLIGRPQPLARGSGNGRHLLQRLQQP